MTLREIKNQITKLAKQQAHTADDLKGMKESELIEEDAENLIHAYCESMGYQINGFPIDKRKTIDDSEKEEYFTIERFRLYRNMLTANHSDVAELSWHYIKLFSLDTYKSQDEFVDKTMEEIADGVHSKIKF